MVRVLEPALLGSTQLESRGSWLDSAQLEKLLAREFRLHSMKESHTFLLFEKKSFKKKIYKIRLQPLIPFVKNSNLVIERGVCFVLSCNE